MRTIIDDHIERPKLCREGLQRCRVRLVNLKRLEAIMLKRREIMDI